MDYIRNYNKVNSESRSFLDYVFDTPFLFLKFKNEIIESHGLAILGNFRLMLILSTIVVYYIA